MAATSLRTTVVQLRRWAETPGDDELLRRFALARDEAAFAELVRRHGTLVLGVARRVLGEHHAAEDVVQASFLLLARKAWRVRWRRSVAPWLHAVAYRLACEARRRRVRQPSSLSQPVEMASDAPPERPLLWQEVRCAIDTELARLSAPLRGPLVLCYLQGLTRDEAALRLGWTLATLKRRLGRGRNLLRVRLTRRGLALGATMGLLAANEALSADAAQEVVGIAAGGPVPGPVAALLGDPRRWRRVAAVALLFIVGLGGAALAMRPAEPAEQPPVKPQAAARIDQVGDPLPEGAIARLGSVRMRPGMLIQALNWSPDGQRLAIWGKAWGFGRDRLVISDAASGRELRVVELPHCDLLATRWLADGRGLAVLKYGPEDHYVWEFTDEKAAPPDRQNAQRGRWTDGVIKIAAISPDGRWLATGRFAVLAGPKPIEVWPLTPNSELKDAKPIELGLQEGNALHVLFSADGRRVFAVSQRLNAVKPVPPAGPGPAPPPAAAEAASRATLAVYEVASVKKQSEFEVPLTQEVMSGLPLPARLLPSADGRTLYLGDEKGSVHAYDWAAGRETATFAAKPAGDPPRFSRPGVGCLALSRDGHKLYSTTGDTGLTAWDLTKSPPSGERLSPPGLRLDNVVPSPDGSLLAVADTNIVVGDVRLLDARTGAEKPRAAPGHNGMIISLALAPDGTVVTAGLDHSVRWWDPRDGKELRHKTFDALHTWVLRPNLTVAGRGLIAHDGDELFYFDVESGKRSKINDEPIKPLAVLLGVSGTNVFHNYSDGKVRQWDAATGRVRQFFDPPRGADGKPAGVEHASMSPDGKQVLILSNGMQMSGQFGWFSGAQISFYDAASGALTRRWTTAEMRFECAAWSPDGRHLLVGGLPMRSPVAQGPAENPLPISAKSGLVLFDARSGEPLRSFEPVARTQYGPVMVAALEFSPDGKFFAVVQTDSVIRIHELATGRVCRSLAGHRARIAQLAFTDRGQRLISVSHDMTGLVWNASLANLAKPSELQTDEQRDRAWAALAKPEWELAGPAVAALAGKSDDLVTLVRTQIKAAEQPAVDGVPVAKLIAQLDDPLFAVRERAAAALARLGREGLPLLEEQLAKGPSAESRKRLFQLIREIDATPVPSGRLRELRVVAMLEQANTEAASGELKRLAAGHVDAPLSRDAAAALKRLK